MKKSKLQASQREKSVFHLRKKATFSFLLTRDGPIPKFQPIPIPILEKIPITDTDTDTSRKITKF